LPQFPTRDPAFAGSNIPASEKCKVSQAITLEKRDATHCNGCYRSAMGSASDISADIQNQWSAVMHAPALYLPSIIVVCIVTFVVVRWRYVKQIEDLNERLRLRDEQIEFKIREIGNLTASPKKSEPSSREANLATDFYIKWDEMNSFELYVAACLWNDEPPPNPYSPLQGHALARFKLLEEGIEKGELDIENQDPISLMQKTHYLTKLTRADLVAFANRRNLRPKFLFANAR
jgi:hypothetical protein